MRARMPVASEVGKRRGTGGCRLWWGNQENLPFGKRPDARRSSCDLRVPEDGHVLMELGTAEFGTLQSFLSARSNGSSRQMPPFSASPASFAERQKVGRLLTGRNWWIVRQSWRGRLIC